MQDPSGWLTWCRAGIVLLTAGIECHFYCWNTTTYEYGGAQVHRLGRGYLGFGWRKVTDAKGIEQVSEFRQNFPYTGTVESSTTTWNGQIISESSTTVDEQVQVYSNGLSADTTYFPFIDSSINNTYSPDNGQQVQAIDKSFSYDNYGNRKVETLGNRAVTGGVLEGKATTANFYPSTPNTAEWLIALVDKTTVLTEAPNAPSKLITTEFDYYANGQLLFTHIEQGGDATLDLKTTYYYDAYGSLRKEESEAPQDATLPMRINEVLYDPIDPRLPKVLTKVLLNAPNHPSTVNSYHPVCDLPTLTTDPNGVSTIIAYDDFCREDVTTVAGFSTDIDYLAPGTSCGVECKTIPTLLIRKSMTGQAPTSVYLNLYGESLVTETEGMFGTVIRQVVEYDAFGRTERESQPFFVGDSIYWNTHSYDDLDRLDLTTLPFNDSNGLPATIDQQYTAVANQMVATTINTLGHNKITHTNSLGQVAQIIDALGNALQYEYDSQGNLTQTTDALNNSIIVGYDLRGRRNSLNDPDLGAITYVNNAFGDLVSQTDAKFQTINMKYDALGRMTQRTVPGIASASGGVSTFVFDTAANGIGLPASTVGPNGYSKTFTYDSYSRPSSDTTIIKGNTFVQSYTYNSAGQLASRSYPESGTGKAFGVQYQYLNGYLQVIKSLADANGDCIEHWRAEQYDALGRTQSDTLGKIVTTTRGFKDGQGVLETIQSVMLVNSGGNVQDLTYTYDENNNVKTRDDLYGAGKETFLYDDLDRLTDYSQAAGSPHAMADPVEVHYDAIGNIEYKSDVGTYSYSQNGAGPHAVTSVALADPLQNVLNLNLAHFAVNLEWEGATIPAPQASIHGSVFTYDASGSVEVSGNRQVHWTAFDKPSHTLLIAADGTERGSSIEYGPSFERVYKQEGEFAGLGGAPIAINETTLYVGKGYEHITDNNGVIKHRYTIAAGGHSIQIEREDGSGQDEPKYLLGDNLGSTNVILDAAGNVSQRLNFDPWGMRTKNGDVAAVNEITNKGYTGHEMDDETGLINMNARIYDPYLGRFLSADPVLPDALDMQQYNRYSYVGNNPLKYVDPTGNTGVCAEFVSCTGIIVASVVDTFFGLLGSDSTPGSSGGFDPASVDWEQFGQQVLVNSINGYFESLGASGNFEYEDIADWIIETIGDVVIGGAISIRVWGDDDSEVRIEVQAGGGVKFPRVTISQNENIILASSSASEDEGFQFINFAYLKLLGSTDLKLTHERYEHILSRHTFGGATVNDKPDAGVWNPGLLSLLTSYENTALFISGLLTTSSLIEFVPQTHKNRIKLVFSAPYNVGVKRDKETVTSEFVIIIEPIGEVGSSEYKIITAFPNG